jgi:hypothetical protein
MHAIEQSARGRADAHQGIADNEGSYCAMTRGFLPGQLLEVFASAFSAHAPDMCQRELARPNIRGFCDLFGRFAPSREPCANRQSVERA